MADILTRTIALACPVEHAFAVFTDKVDLWWPRGHRRTRDAALSFRDDALVERAPDGSEWVMGRVTAIEPPSHLALDWFPGSPAAPTSVDIRFAGTAQGTTITVTHTALTPAAAQIWPQRVATFTKGWDTVLPALKSFIEEAWMAKGTKDDPWQLKTPPGTSDITLWRDPSASPPALVCVAGGTELRYHISAPEDLAAMLKAHGDWMELGNADEQKPAKDGSIEAWARSPDNPKGGWYGLKKGLRGRFANYVTPVAEALGLVELEHNPKNNRARAK